MPALSVVKSDPLPTLTVTNSEPLSEDSTAWHPPMTAPPGQGTLSRVMFGPSGPVWTGSHWESNVMDQSAFPIGPPGSALAKGAGGAISGLWAGAKELPLVGKFLKIPEAIYKGASEAINPPVEPFPAGKGTGTKYGGPMRPEYGPAKPMPPVTPTAPPAGYTPTATEPVTPFPPGKGTGTKYGGPRTDVFGKPGRIIPRGQFTPPPEPPGPEMNIEGVGPVRPIQTGPVNVPGATPQTVTPFKAEEAVQPVDRVEMNRILHAKVQRLNLPGSPAGTKSPGLLTDIAKSKFNMGYDRLSVDQLKQLYEHLDTLAK